MALTATNPDLPRLSIGFGASGAWALPTFPEERATEIIHRAVALGIRHFDTAPFYQNGRAEARLARALAEARRLRPAGGEPIIISTKIGKSINRRGKIIRDFRPDTIETTLRRSRELFGVETLDIVYLHGPNEHEVFSCLPQLLLHKIQGKLNAIGICSDGGGLAKVIHHPDIDVIMARYSLFDQNNGRYLATAKENGKTVVAISPLGQALWKRGFFAPRTSGDVWYVARALVRSRHQLASTRQAAEADSADGLDTLSRCWAFLNTCPFVDVALTTTTRPGHLEASVRAQVSEIPTEIRDKLRARHPLSGFA